jgi:hypothetical protein
MNFSSFRLTDFESGFEDAIERRAVSKTHSRRDTAAKMKIASQPDQRLFFGLSYHIFFCEFFLLSQDGPLISSGPLLLIREDSWSLSINAFHAL